MPPPAPRAGPPGPRRHSRLSRHSRAAAEDGGRMSPSGSALADSRGGSLSSLQESRGRLSKIFPASSPINMLGLVFSSPLSLIRGGEYGVRRMSLVFRSPSLETSYREFYWDRYRRYFVKVLALLLLPLLGWLLLKLTVSDADTNEVLIVDLPRVLSVLLLLGMLQFSDCSRSVFLSALTLWMATTSGLTTRMIWQLSVLSDDRPLDPTYIVVYTVFPAICGPVLRLPFLHVVFVEFVATCMFILSTLLADPSPSSDGGASDVGIDFDRQSGYRLISLVVVVNVLFSFVAFFEELHLRREYAYVHKLNVENHRLKRNAQNSRSRMSMANVSNSEQPSIDLESPIEKAMQVLREIHSQSAEDTRGSVEFVIDVLAKQRGMLNPQVADQLKGASNLDPDTKKWLMELAAKTDQISAIPTEENSSRPSRRQTLHAPLTWDHHFRPSFNLNSIDALTAAEEEELSNLLESSNEWGYDIFKIDKLTGGRPLFFVVMYVIKKFDLLNSLAIDESRLRVFLKTIEAGYRPCPYHNNIHAAEVVLNMVYLMSSPMIGDRIEDKDFLAGIIAAACHDFGHMGTNNNWHIRIQSEQALMYNDKSVLENFHVASSFQLLRRDECNFLAGWELERYLEFKALVVDMVLATDMAMHFATLSEFKTKLNDDDFLEVATVADKTLILRMALKVADIGHASKPVTLHCEWTNRIQEEFYSQGDMERERQLGISPFMDRTTSSIPKSQIGFLQFVVMPLFDSFNVDGEFSVLCENLRVNLAFWQEKLSKENAPDPLPSSPKSSASAAPK